MYHSLNARVKVCQLGPLGMSKPSHDANAVHSPPPAGFLREDNGSG